MESGGTNIYYAASNNLINRIDRFGLNFGEPPFPAEPNPTDPRPEASPCPPGQIKDPNCMRDAHEEYSDDMQDLSAGTTVAITCTIIAGLSEPVIAVITLGVIWYGAKVQSDQYWNRYKREVNQCPCVDVPVL